MNVTVEKVKLVKATETQKPETKAEAPVTETVTPTILEKLENVLGKLMGTEKHAEVPGVPGTQAEEPVKEEPKKDECESDCCPTCGAKKAVKAEEPEEEPEKEEKKAEEPAKEEPKMETKAEEPEPKKEEKAPAVDLSNEAWRANFYANSSTKPASRTSDWKNACEAFTQTLSKE